MVEIVKYTRTYKCNKCYNILVAITPPVIKCVTCICHDTSEIDEDGHILNGNEVQKFTDLFGNQIPRSCTKRCKGTYFECKYQELPKASGVFTTTNNYSGQDRREVLNYSSYWLEGWVHKLNTSVSSDKPAFYAQKVRINIPDLTVQEQHEDTQTGDLIWKDSHSRTKRDGSISYGFNMFNTLVKALVTHTHSWIKIPIVDTIPHVACTNTWHEECCVTNPE